MHRGGALTSIDPYCLAFIHLGRVSVKAASKKGSKIARKLDRRNQVDMHVLKILEMFRFDIHYPYCYLNLSFSQSDVSNLLS